MNAQIEISPALVHEIILAHPFLKGINPRYVHLLTDCASFVRFGVGDDIIGVLCFPSFAERAPFPGCSPVAGPSCRFQKRFNIRQSTESVATLRQQVFDQL